jgi:hypothetical protein
MPKPPWNSGWDNKQVSDPASIQPGRRAGSASRRRAIPSSNESDCSGCQRHRRLEMRGPWGDFRLQPSCPAQADSQSTLKKSASLYSLDRVAGDEIPRGRPHEIVAITAIRILRVDLGASTTSNGGNFQRRRSHKREQRFFSALYGFRLPVSDLLLDNPVALAGRLFQLAAIQNGDIPARVRDHSRLLQNAG